MHFSCAVWNTEESCIWKQADKHGRQELLPHPQTHFWWGSVGQQESQKNSQGMA